MLRTMPVLAFLLGVALLSPPPVLGQSKSSAQPQLPTVGSPISSAHCKGPDGLEGWKLSYQLRNMPDDAAGPDRFPMTLVIAKRGHVLRRIQGDPFIWNWYFADGQTVALETGPLHFGTQCEMIDIRSGNGVAQADCYNIPLPKDAWVQKLLHGKSVCGQEPPAKLNPQLEQAERTVQSLAMQFPKILADTPLESQLRAKCAVNCAAVVDSQKGLTVAQELQNIETAKLTIVNHLAAEIQHCVNDYVMSLPATPEQGLNPNFVANQVLEVLSGVAGEPPVAFVFRSPKNQGILLFYDVVNSSTIAGNSSAYATLAAFNVHGHRLTLSDTTGNTFDGYGRIEVKKLSIAPTWRETPGEIALLVSGYVNGANGPNCRMRVFTYAGKGFRTIWMPANVWGSFTTQVTRGGFVVRGQYYRSTRQRNDHFAVTPYGIDLITPLG